MKNKKSLFVIPTVLVTCVPLSTMAITLSSCGGQTKPSTEGTKKVGIYAIRNQTLVGLADDVTRTDVEKAIINKTLTLPDEVKIIGPNAFNASVDSRLGAITNDTTIEIDISKVEEISEFAYYENAATTVKFTLPAGETAKLKTIGKCAFAYSGITSFKIPSSVTSIGSSCFIGCKSLATLDVTESRSDISFGGITIFPKSSSGSIIMNDPTTSSNQTIWKQMVLHGISPKWTQSKIVDSTVTAYETQYKPIPDELFKTEKITSANNEESLSITGLSARYTLNDFTVLDVPNTIGTLNVTKIGASAFEGWANLTKVDLGSVVEIGNAAFKDCTNLGINKQIVYIPATVKNFGYDVFSGCTSLLIGGNGIKFAKGDMQWIFKKSDETTETYTPALHGVTVNAETFINYGQRTVSINDNPASYYLNAVTGCTKLYHNQKVQLVAVNSNNEQIIPSSIEWSLSEEDQKHAQIFVENGKTYLHAISVGATGTTSAAATCTISPKCKDKTTGTTKDANSITISCNDVLNSTKNQIKLDAVTDENGIETENPVGTYVTQDTTITPTLGNSDTVLEYSTNYGKKWQTCASGTSISIKANDNIYFRANVWSQTGKINKIAFETTGKVYLSGRIDTLNGGGNVDVAPQASAFESCFEGNTSIVEVPSDFLPYKILSENCYKNLFKNNTSLTSLPRIRSKSIAKGSCNSTFYGCSSATGKAWVSATQIPQEGIQNMYYGCSSLTEALLFFDENIGEDGASGLLANCSKITTIYIPNMANWPTATNALAGWLTNTGPTPTTYQNTNRFYKNSNLVKPGSASDDQISNNFWKKGTLVTTDPVQDDTGTQDEILDGKIGDKQYLSVYCDNQFCFHRYDDDTTTGDTVPTLFFSTDLGETWTEVTNKKTTSTSYTCPKYRNCLFKGGENNKTLGWNNNEKNEPDDKSRMLFFVPGTNITPTTSTVPSSFDLALNGSIRAILDGGDPTVDVTITPACFSRLFRESFFTRLYEGLIPFKKVGFHTFFQAFQWCAEIKEIPSKLLPATEFGGLTKGSDYVVDSYHGMFKNDMSNATLSYSKNNRTPKLQSLPSKLLHAPKHVPIGLCNEMFSDNTSLTNIPEKFISADIIDGWAFRRMFYNCTSITTLPYNLIDAQQLGPDACQEMFGASSGKTMKLTTGPELNLRNVSKESYHRMFANNTNLNFLCLDLDSWTTASGDQITGSWLEGLSATTGVILLNKKLENSLTRGTSTVPSDWTIYYLS